MAVPRRMGWRAEKARVIWRIAGLPESQSPEGVNSHPSERRLKPTPVLRRHDQAVAASSRTQERCPVRVLKEMSGTPKSR